MSYSNVKSADEEVTGRAVVAGPGAGGGVRGHRHGVGGGARLLRRAPARGRPGGPGGPGGGGGQRGRQRGVVGARAVPRRAQRAAAVHVAPRALIVKARRHRLLSAVGGPRMFSRDLAAAAAAGRSPRCPRFVSASLILMLVR